MTRAHADSDGRADDRLRAPEICPVCGAGGAKRAQKIEATTILRCRSCGVGWWDFSSCSFDAFYEKGYYFARDSSPGVGYEDYDALKPAQRATSRLRLEKIRKVTGRPSSLLDVGCGLGHFLSEAKADGWKVTGFEVSRFAAQEVRRRLDIDVVDGDLGRISHTFDVVTAWDVFEHVPDPLAFLVSCRRLLTQDGILIVSTGNFASLAARLSGRRWHLYNLPEHLFFHTPQSIAHLADKAGVTITDLSHPSAYYPVSYLRERLRRKVRIRLPATRLDSLIVPVNLFDIMEVWFRRTGDPETVRSEHDLIR